MVLNLNYWLWSNRDMQVYNYKKHIFWIGLLSAIIFVLYFLIVLKPELKELKQKTQVNLPKVSVKPLANTVRYIKHGDIVAEITQVAQQHHVMSIMIQDAVNEDQSARIHSISLLAKADFINLLSFIESLHHLSILLNDFSMHFGKRFSRVVHSDTICV